MLLTNLRRLYRDRRRIAVAYLLIMATVWLGRDSLPDPLPMVSSEVLAALPVLLAIPLISVFARRYRHWIEIVFFGTFLFVGLGVMFPDSPFDHRGIYAYTPAGFIFYGLSIAMSAILLYGHWSDRFPRLRPLTLKAATRSRLDARTLWYGLVPTPGHLERNPDPEVVSIDYADAARRTVRLITWPHGRGMGETLLYIDAIEPFRHVVLRMRVVAGKSDAATEGTTSFTVTDAGDHRKVRVTHEIATLAPRRILRGWLDDTLGRIMDARVAAVERGVCRASRGRSESTMTLWFEEGREIAPACNDRRTGRPTAFGRRRTDRETPALGALGHG